MAFRDVLALQGVFLFGYAPSGRPVPSAASGGGGGTFNWYEPCPPGSVFDPAGGRWCVPSDVLVYREAPPGPEARRRASSSGTGDLPDEILRESPDPSGRGGQAPSGSPELTLGSSLGSVPVSLPTLLAGGAAAAAWATVAKRNMSPVQKFLASLGAEMALDYVKPALYVKSPSIGELPIEPWGAPEGKGLRRKGPSEGMRRKGPSEGLRRKGPSETLRRDGPSEGLER